MCAKYLSSLDSNHSTSFSPDVNAQIHLIKLSEWDVNCVYVFVQSLSLHKKNENFLLDFIDEMQLDGNMILTKLLQLRTKRMMSFLVNRDLDKEAYMFARRVFFSCLSRMKREKKYEKKWVNVFLKLLVPIKKHCLKSKEVPRLFGIAVHADTIFDEKKYFEDNFQSYIDLIQSTKSYFGLKKAIEKKTILTEPRKSANLLEDFENEEDLDEEFEEMRTLKFVPKESDQKEMISIRKRIASTQIDDPILQKENEKNRKDIKRKTIVVPLNIYNVIKEKRFHFKVKIVIGDIYNTTETKKKKVRKKFSRLLNTFDPIFKVRSRFGLFHTALIVGPWYIEWTESEIVNIRNFSSRKAFFAMDLLTKDISFNKQISIIQKLSKTIHKWNTQMNYSQFKGRNSGNCQHFTDDVLENIEINFEEAGKEGIFKNFFDNLRNGNDSVIFLPGEEFLDAFPKISEKKRSFSTHKELDKYMIDLTLKDKDVDSNFPLEIRFLKAIDRGFWLRHFKFPKVESFTPLKNKENERLLCPFQDPRKTASFKEIDECDE